MLMFIALTQIAFADESHFAQGNKAYAAGDFKAAIADYEAAVTAREWNANLFYNLGNAYYRVHDFGRAILNYERALQIDPHHPEAEANLQLVRDQTRGLELTAEHGRKIPESRRHIDSCDKRGDFVLAGGDPVNYSGSGRFTRWRDCLFTDQRRLRLGSLEIGERWRWKRRGHRRRRGRGSACRHSRHRPQHAGVADRKRSRDFAATR